MGAFRNNATNCNFLSVFCLVVCKNIEAFLNEFIIQFVLFGGMYFNSVTSQNVKMFDPPLKNKILLRHITTHHTINVK